MRDANRITKANDFLRSLVQDLEAGRVFAEDFDPNLVDRLTKVLQSSGILMDGEKKAEKFASVNWHVEDVLSLREDWTEEKAKKWLSCNERHLRDRLVELGFETMEALLPPLDDEDDDEPMSLVAKLKGTEGRAVDATAVEKDKPEAVIAAPGPTPAP